MAAPGPYTAGTLRNAPGYEGPAIYDAAGNAIAHTTRRAANDGTAELLAAAPQLHEALSRICNFHEGTKLLTRRGSTALVDLDAIRALLAKLPRVTA